MTALVLPPRCARLATRILAVLLLVPLTVGLLLGLDTTAATWARHQVPLGFTAPRAQLSGAVAIYVHNLHVLATPIVGAALLCWLRITGRSTIAARVLLDAFLSCSVATNLALLALSVAGYGPWRMALWLPHLPLEFAAIALALSTYLLARRTALKATHLAACLAGCAALLALAALLETYALPHQ